MDINKLRYNSLIILVILALMMSLVNKDLTCNLIIKKWLDASPKISYAISSVIGVSVWEVSTHLRYRKWWRWIKNTVK